MNQKNNFLPQPELPEPGTLWFTLYAVKDYRVLTETGEFLSDDEFDDLRYTGNLHCIQEENYPEGIPAIYEIAPSSRNELQELFERTQKRVQDFRQKLIDAVLRHVDHPQTEIDCLDHECDRYEQVTAVLKTTITQERDAYQQKHKHNRDTGYSMYMINYKRSLTSLMEVDFEIRTYRVILEASRFLQKTPDETWTSDDLSNYVNTVIGHREFLKEEDADHPYLSLLAEKIFAGKVILFKRQCRILRSIPSKNLQVGPRRKRRPTVASGVIA